jgi:aerobic-type carbon monoxide dehydrogenase small subunit (CoxS/CutS family)
MTMSLVFTLNGEERQVEVEPNLTLLDLLRDRLGITSPKKACEQGECGACTILLNGKAVNSCLTLAVTVNGKTVETIESLGTTELHPLQKYFYEMAASQCGFCTPGMILAAKALLDENPAPTYEQVKYGLSGNMCRCTGYVKPIQAVLAAAQEMRAGVAGVAEKE